MAPTDRSEQLERREFLKQIAGLAAAPAIVPTMAQAQQTVGQGAQARPRASEFAFARLRYTSGDWEFNPKVAANVLDAIVQYTNVPVFKNEVVITADSEELSAFPFIFMTGHKLVRFSEKERKQLRRYVEQGGLLFSDDCNHDVSGLYSQSFEQEMKIIFPEPNTLAKIPNTHPIYSAFFRYPDGPPQTSHELNGWGDDMVHAYLRTVDVNGRIGVLYSNKDYGCEWDYDWKNKRFQRDDNTKFAVNIVTYAMTA